MINYLFSSVDKENGFNENQIKYLKGDLKNNLSISFIASTFSNYERNDQQLDRFKKYFVKINISFKDIYLIDKRVDKEEARKYINKSEIVFLLGGSPELQMQSILEYDLVSDIKKTNIVIGVSAGAMNQTKRIIYLDDFDDFKLKDYSGLGYTNIIMYPHFDINNEDILNEVDKLNEISNILLLPNESFIRIKDGKFSIIGSYYESNLLDQKKIH